MRGLTSLEIDWVAALFGNAVDYDRVRLHLRKWWPFQPRDVIMAPDGAIWFHPNGDAWRDDYSEAPLSLRALLVHELTHVWQHQRGLYLPLRRHPFCRYRYRLKDGWPLTRYGIEQQAMIVEHAFRARQSGRPDTRLETLLAEAGFASQRSAIVAPSAPALGASTDASL